MKQDKFYRDNKNNNYKNKNYNKGYNKNFYKDDDYEDEKKQYKKKENKKKDIVTADDFLLHCLEKEKMNERRIFKEKEKNKRSKKERFFDED